MAWLLLITIYSPLGSSNSYEVFETKTQCEQALVKTHLLNNHGELDGLGFKECREVVKQPESVLVIME